MFVPVFLRLFDHASENALFPGSALRAACLVRLLQSVGDAVVVEVLLAAGHQPLALKALLPSDAGLQIVVCGQIEIGVFLAVEYALTVKQ